MSTAMIVRNQTANSLVLKNSFVSGVRMCRATSAARSPKLGPPPPWTWDPCGGYCPGGGCWYWPCPCCGYPPCPCCGYCGCVGGGYCWPGPCAGGWPCGPPGSLGGLPYGPSGVLIATPSCRFPPAPRRYPEPMRSNQPSQPPSAGYEPPMFVFFSNQLGCLPSLLLSLFITLILLVALGVINL